MTESFKSRFLAALEKCMEDESARIAALTQAGSVDEANLRKAARNVYGIYATLLKTAAEASTYEEHLEKVPSAWRAAREKAIAYGDFARVAVEDAKLSALDAIRALYALCRKEEKDNA